MQGLLLGGWKRGTQQREVKLLDGVGENLLCVRSNVAAHGLLLGLLLYGLAEVRKDYALMPASCLKKDRNYSNSPHGPLSAPTQAPLFSVPLTCASPMGQSTRL
jgi:hypothetical protein